MISSRVSCHLLPGLPIAQRRCGKHVGDGARSIRPPASVQYGDGDVGQRFAPDARLRQDPVEHMSLAKYGRR